MLYAGEIDSPVQKLVDWNAALGTGPAYFSQAAQIRQNQLLGLVVNGGVIQMRMLIGAEDVSTTAMGAGNLHWASTSYAPGAQQVVFQHPLLSHAETHKFLFHRPSADVSALRQIYEEVAERFSGCALECSASADMETGQWHFYLEVNSNGAMDTDDQICKELDLHAWMNLSQQLNRAKEYFHVTVY